MNLTFDLAFDDQTADDASAPPDEDYVPPSDGTATDPSPGIAADNAGTDNADTRVPKDDKVIYVPEFLVQYEDFEKFPPDVCCKRLEDKNWITDGLRAEINDQCFSRDNADPNNRNQRSGADFQAACLHLFPPGRVFASYKQLQQAADIFLSSWAVKATRPGKSIRCFCSAPHNKKDRRHHSEDNRRKNDVSPKLEVKCPFYIGYNYIKKPSKDQRWRKSSSGCGGVRCHQREERHACLGDPMHGPCRERMAPIENQNYIC